MSDVPSRSSFAYTRACSRWWIDVTTTPEPLVSSRAIDDRLGEAEARLDHTIAHRALVRYDAYNELSGRQSTSIALLDATGSGVVVSSIHHRDQARVYAKQVHEGRGELELAPEEEEAVRIALAGEPAPPPAA